MITWSNSETCGTSWTDFRGGNCKGLKSISLILVPCLERQRKGFINLSITMGIYCLSKFLRRLILLILEVIISMSSNVSSLERDCDNSLSSPCVVSSFGSNSAFESFNFFRTTGVNVPITIKVNKMTIKVVARMALWNSGRKNGFSNNCKARIKQRAPRKPANQMNVCVCPVILRIGFRNLFAIAEIINTWTLDNSTAI